MRRPTLALTIALSLLAPATAGASTVSVVGNTLTIGGDPTSNSIQASFAAGTYTISDSIGIELVGGAGCPNAEHDNTATCTATINAVEANLGGGRDYLNLSDPSLPAFAGI